MNLDNGRREWIAWAVVLALAVVLRCAGLGALPLATGEANRSLAALSLLRGEVPQTWDEPALELLIAGSFFLFGASEGTARLVPTLAGVLAVALVGLFRSQWGRGPALGAAALLACSPSMVAFSRMAAPESIVIALLIGLLWSVRRLTQAPSYPMLLALAALLAVLLHLGSTALSAVLVLAGVATVRWYLGGDSPAVLWQTVTHDRDRPVQLGVAFLLPFTLIGSGLLLYPAGFGLPSLFAWFSIFEPGIVISIVSPWLKMLVYDPAGVVLGALAAGLALLRPQGWEAKRTLLIWTAGAMIAALFLPGRDNGALALILLPLLLLGGNLLGHMWEAMTWESWRRLTVAAPLALVIGGTLLLVSMRRMADGSGSILTLGLAAGMLALLAAVALWPSQKEGAGPPLPYPAAVLLLAGVLLAGTSHSLTYLSFMAGPAEWFGEPRPDPQTFALLRSLHVRPPAAPVPLLAASPVTVDPKLPSPVRWALRDRGGIRYVSNASEGSALALAVGAPDNPSLSGYTQRSLPLEAQWHPVQVDALGLWRWFLVREPYGAAPVERRVTLYRRS